MKVVGRRPPRLFSNAQWLAAILMILFPLAAFYQSVWLSQNKTLFTPFIMRVQSERIDCPYCGGLGTVRPSENSTNMMMCPICFGVGGHYVRRLPGRHEVLCPACGGMGRLWDPDLGYARYCRRCGGRGLISVLDSVEALGEKPGDTTTNVPSD
jgi:hypothetical protein